MPSSKRAKLPSWLLARKIRITLQADTKMFRRFSGLPQLPASEFQRIQYYINLIRSNNADCIDDFESHGTGRNARTKADSTMGSRNWNSYPQTNLPGAQGPVQPTQDTSKPQGGSSQALSSTLRTPDIAEFVRLDKAIYDGETRKKSQVIENWLGDLENSTT